MTQRNSRIETFTKAVDQIAHVEQRQRELDGVEEEAQKERAVAAEEAHQRQLKEVREQNEILEAANIDRTSMKKGASKIVDLASFEPTQRMRESLLFRHPSGGFIVLKNWEKHFTLKSEEGIKNV